MRTKSAFTLIEILVVIAIIAILAAILLPVFAQAQRSAKITVDVSQMRQVGMASRLYAMDWDDKFPYSAGVLAQRDAIDKFMVVSEMDPRTRGLANDLIVSDNNRHGEVHQTPFTFKLSYIGLREAFANRMLNHDTIDSSKGELLYLILEHPSAGWLVHWTGRPYFQTDATGERPVDTRKFLRLNLDGSISHRFFPNTDDIESDWGRVDWFIDR